MLNRFLILDELHKNYRMDTLTFRFFFTRHMKHMSRI